MLTAVESQRRAARIARATQRAWEQGRAGVRPILVERDDSPDGGQSYQVWIVPSRSEPGRHHRVELLADMWSIETQCQCEAGQAGQMCWHRSLVRLAVLERVGSDDATPRPLRPARPAAPARQDQATLTGRRSA